MTCQQNISANLKENILKQQEFTPTCVVCKSEQQPMFAYHSYHYYRCPRCLHVTTYPIPDKNTIFKHYDRKFNEGNYQLLRDFSQDYRKIYDYYVQILNGELSKRGLRWDGLKVLDVGCFTGEFLQLLKAQGADVYGLELQSRAVEIANRKLDGRVFQVDIDRADFPQMSFDLISLLGVIEHVVDPMRLLLRSQELLRPGGLLLIQTPNSGSLLARSMRGLWPPYAPVEHIHLFSRQSLTAALLQMGFSEVIFEAHRKKLPVDYVFNMLQNYGPEFHRLFKPVYTRLPEQLTRLSLTFYVGEMLVLAHKP
jgi:2-polyprenyl-3-methyl-5-hydroxy-6-metoxy-1,4-benzoquinol methylase